MSKTAIPETWRVITGHLIDAEAARQTMRDGDATRPMRDAATATYVRAADALVAELSVLRQESALVAIAEFLRKEYP